jgi:hypothetical protein
MHSLGSQKPIRTTPFRVVPQSLGSQCQARLLKSSFEQSSMEFADDVASYRTRLPKDAVAGENLAVIGDHVVRTQWSQLPQHRLRGVSRRAHERPAVAPPRLSRRFDALLTACSETLRQKAGQAGKAPHRKAEIDLLASQSVKIGRLAGFSSALTDRQVSERDKTLEMSMRDSSVHPGGFGRVVDRPFGLMHIEVEQDAPTGSILKRADRAVDLACLVLAHVASLSAHVGWEPDRPAHTLFLRSPMERELSQAVSTKGRSRYLQGTPPRRRLVSRAPLTRGRRTGHHSLRRLTATDVVRPVAH